MQHPNTKNKRYKSNAHCPYTQSTHIKIPYQEGYMFVDGFIYGIAYKSYPDM